ncbi:hypothetical protein SAMN05216319_5219 [Duganella sp. CF402]|uniref:hypothetical protein n=1 Tax=unclassified Duganella TaxID=2636909 RepID=UPI0008B4FDAA|nr:MULTISPECIES: hypothetical protein [unclassified Duganella]RZT05486.1 hypothetical protein EV582_3800 [Duganella sp. BK701]SEN02324.1 hypothetical protein SAMN05216319_5219 [Duganella sp. CF402]
MTMPIKFDTREYAKTLAEAGVPQDQADAHAQALLAALSEGTVTPGEVVVLKAEVMARIDALKAEVMARIDAVKAEVMGRIDAVKAEVMAQIDAVKAEVMAQIDAVKAEVMAEIVALKHQLQVLKVRVDAKFTIVFCMLGVSFALHAVTIGMLWRILDRLP